MMKKLILLFALVTSVSFAAPVEAGPRSTFYFKSKKSYKLALKKHLRKKVKNDEWIWERWQMALWSNAYDRPKTSLNLLKSIEKNHKKVVSDDLFQMNLARTHFQLGNMTKAIQIYDEIPKSSDYWLLSLEEKSWAYMHVGSYDKAIASLTTLTTPVFASVTPAETFFAKGFAHLRICDYKKVFATTQKFKKLYGPRIKELSEVAKMRDNTFSQQALERLKKSSPTLLTVGHLAKSLPRHFWRDRFFQRHLASWKRDQFKSSSKAHKRLLERIQYLANVELKEISQIIQKMHILEAEAIQRMYVKPLGGQVLANSKASQNSTDVLHFPSTDEVWLDELDSYSAQVKDCPSLRSAGL